MREFVAGLLPTEEEDAVAALLAAGDEASLRQVLELEPGHEQAVVGAGRAARARGATTRPRPRRSRCSSASPSRPTPGGSRRSPASASTPSDDVTDELDGLLDRVKDDDDARQRFVDLLEVMGPDDPRTAGYRKQLTARLF